MSPVGSKFPTKLYVLDKNLSVQVPRLLNDTYKDIYDNEYTYQYHKFYNEAFAISEKDQATIDRGYADGNANNYRLTDFVPTWLI